MLQEFKNHIDNNFQLLRELPFLLACSGGIDSVVLAYLCTKSNLEFSIAHCNFNLRGEDSNEDEVFVKNLANSINKPFFVTHFDTMSYVKKHKTSVQIAARELRYDWFLGLLKEHSFGCIVTAHQADDNVETFLINLSRGTGIDGLMGIPEETATLARPLLKFSRAEIEAYAASEKLEWREDKSNAEIKYIRNKIRHQIVPVLKELHPTFLDNFTKTQYYLSETAAIVDDYIQQLKALLFIKEDGVIKIEVASLLKLNPLKGYIHGLFKDYGFTAWDDIVALLSGNTGKEICSKTHRLVKYRDSILLQQIEAEDTNSYLIHEKDTTVNTPIRLTIETIDGLEEASEHMLYVAKETLKYPLIVRKWRKGDYFYPFGMRGKKKVAKFYKDEKMDVISKEKQWLLCSGDAIVWIIGKRADNRFKVTEETKHILKFTIIE